MKVTTIDQYEKEVNNGIVFLDFYSDWCLPCKQLSPIIDELEKRYQNIKFMKINIDELEEVAIKYAALSVPTLLILKDGEVLAKKSGFLPGNELEKWISNTIDE